MLFTNENNEPILLQAQDSVTSDEMLSEIAHFANNPLLFGSNTREVESNDDSQATVDGTQESQVVSGTVNSSSQVKVSKVTSESSNASKRKTGTLKISELGSQQSQEKDDSRYPGYIPILDEEITAQLVEGNYS